MRLPDAVEQAIRTIEAEYGARKEQHAGVPRLRELRSAIETALRPARDADAELRRLSEAATQGPWRTGVPTSYCIVDEQAREMASTEYLIDDGGTAEEAQANAAFIVAAVNALRRDLGEK